MGSCNMSNTDRNMPLTQGDTKKSALKKSATVDGSSLLSVGGLGKRQKSFVQFDDNTVVIEDKDGDNKGKEEPKTENKNKEPTKGNMKTKGAVISSTSSSWTDSLKLTKKKLGKKETEKESKNQQE